MSLIFFIIALLMLWKGGDEAAILAWPMLIISLIVMIVKIKGQSDHESRMAEINSQMERDDKIHKLKMTALSNIVCPTCAETIKKDAKKCRFCGEENLQE